MEKTKVKPTIQDNGEKKKKLTKDEMIAQLETEIAHIVKLYHQKTGALAHLKEID